MVTTITEFAAQFFAGQARTSSAGAAVDDVTGEDLRLVAQLFSPGVVMDPSDSWQVFQRAAGANMSVDVGSGDADADLAIVEGTASGQGNYVVRKETGTVNVTVPAADVSNPRIDAVYLVVYDNAYDASSRVLPRIAYRDGTPAGSPSPPGPDANWDAFLLLATISVPAGDTAINTAQIIDQRATAGLATGISPTSLGGVEVDESSTISDTTTSSFATMDNALTLTIPATWGSWKCTVWASWTSSAGAGTTYDVRFNIDGTTVNTKTTLSASGTVEGEMHMGRRTGMTTTGSRTVALEAKHNVATSVAVQNGILYARAVRTS